MMNQLSLETISVVVGLGLTNLISIFGAYVTMKVNQAKLEVLVGKLEKDVDNLGRMYRREYLNQEREKL